jgi:hypothetical protein
VEGGSDMSLSTILQGEVFTLRSYKQYAGYSWANNYEIEAVQDIPNPITELEFIASRIVDLEKTLHLSGVVIDRVTISTYVPDSLPYNPNNVATFPFSVRATRQIVSEFLPLELCLFIRRNVSFGRDGRILYRGVLMEIDMNSTEFRPLLTANAVSGFQNVINSWRSVGLGNAFRLVMASGFPAPNNVRPVTSLQVSEKIVVKKYNNRYFRRNP